MSVNASQQQPQTGPPQSPSSGSNMDLEFALRSHPLFAGLDTHPGLYNSIANLLTIRHVGPGDILIRAGEEGRALFLLLRGSVAVTSKDGESVYATFGAGSFFGEIAAVKEGIRRTASVVATERSVVATLQRTDLKNVIVPKYGPEIEERLREAAEARIRMLHPSQRTYLQNAAEKAQSGMLTLSTPAIGGPTNASSSLELRRQSSSLRSGSFSASRVVVPSGADENSLLPPMSPIGSTSAGALGGSAFYIVDPTTAPGSLSASGGAMADTLSLFNTVVPTNLNPAATPGGGLGGSAMNLAAAFGPPISSLRDLSHTTTSASASSSSILVSSSRNSIDALNDNDTSSSTESLPAITLQAAEDVYDPCAPRTATIGAFTSDAPIVGSSSDSADSAFAPASPSPTTIVAPPPSPMSPTITPPTNKHMSAVAALNPGRRRASVAVWSDPRLMAKVQAAQSSSSTSGTGSSSTGSGGTSPTSALAVRTGALGPRLGMASSESLASSSASSSDLMRSTSALGLPRAGSVTLALKAGGARGRKQLMHLFAEHKVAKRIVLYMGARACFVMQGASSEYHAWFNTHRQVWCRVMDLGGVKAVDDVVLGMITRDCAQYIKHMNLKSCFGITDQALSPFLLRCTSLVSLNLHGCWEISPQAFAAAGLVQYLPTLRSLDLSNLRKMDDVALRKCLLMFPNLDTLTLGYCKALSMGIFQLESSTHPAVGASGGEEAPPHSAPPAVTSDRLPAVVAASTENAVANQAALPSTESRQQASTPAAEHTHIRNRSHSDLSAPPPASLLTHPTKHSTWDTWRHLRTLNLQRCTGLRDDAFAQWPRISAEWALETLVLGDCSLLTDTAMGMIAGTCPRLATLGLAFCCALSEGAMAAIVQMPRLKVVDLSFCGSLVSQASMMALARECKELERVGVRGCVRVDDELVEGMLREAARVKVVNIGQCRGVSPGMKARVRERWVLLETESVIEYVEPKAGDNGAGKEEAGGSGGKARAAGLVRRSTAPTGMKNGVNNPSASASGGKARIGAADAASASARRVSEQAPAASARARGVAR